jgi:hypothetical protein
VLSGPRRSRPSSPARPVFAKAWVLNARPVDSKKAKPQKGLPSKRGTISCSTRYLLLPRTLDPPSLRCGVSLSILRMLLMRLRRGATLYPHTRLPRAHEEEFTEASRLVSPEVLLRSPTPGSEEDLQGEEPDQPWTRVPRCPTTPP